MSLIVSFNKYESWSYYTPGTKYKIMIKTLKYPFFKELPVCHLRRQIQYNVTSTGRNNDRMLTYADLRERGSFKHFLRRDDVSVGS